MKAGQGRFLARFDEDRKSWITEARAKNAVKEVMRRVEK